MSSARPVTRIIIKPATLGLRGQNYSVSLDGQPLIDKTRNPTGDTCRLLVSLGRTGRLEVWDDERPYARLIIPDIAKAARITVAEGEAHGPRFTAYRECPTFQTATKEAA